MRLFVVQTSDDESHAVWS